MSDEERAAVEEMAVGLLWRWTGQRFGQCTVTLRPCREECPPGMYPTTFWGNGPYPKAGPGTGMGPYQRWTPALIGGSWYNISCGGCGAAACNCGLGNGINLPGPVVAVDEVIVDGTPLAPSEYLVFDYQTLVRRDGQPWPASCQDMLVPITEPGTWQVTYQRGHVPPAGGQMAAGQLACELAKAMCGDPSCGLPLNATSVSRQGVSISMNNPPFADLQAGATGIWAVDAWVASISNTPQGGTIASPDYSSKRNRRAGRVQTWPL